MFGRLVRDLYVAESKRSSPRPIDQSIAEAAGNYLGKQSKLETAHDAVLVQDAHELAEMDREQVRRYRDQKLFGGDSSGKKGSDDMGDMIVCDDYRVNQWLPWAVLALIAAGLLALIAALYPWDREPSSPRGDKYGVYDIDKFIPTDEQKKVATNGDGKEK